MRGQSFTRSTAHIRALLCIKASTASYRPHQHVAPAVAPPRLRLIQLALTPVVVPPKLPVTPRTTTPHAERLSQRQHRLTLRLPLVRASLQLRPTRLRSERAKAQQPRLIRRLHLVLHAEQVTTRLLRLTLTPRALLVVQLVQADQRPRTAIHQPWFTNA